MRTFIYIVCGFAGAWVIGWLIERRLLRPYWSRACTGAQWRRRFPRASKTEIRDFLSLFVGAFGFSRSRRLRFTPDDRVMDVYRTLHPPKWASADAMELESFAEDFRKTYGIDLVPLSGERTSLWESCLHLHDHKVPNHPMELTESRAGARASVAHLER